MPRSVYSLLFYGLLPFIVLRAFWRSIREPDYRMRLGERFGYLRVPAKASPRIWVHAVSAGETIAAVPLVRLCLDAGMEVIVTNMTPTGRERVLTLLGDRQGDVMMQAWVPYDAPGFVDRFLEAADPDCLVIIDTELWPNMLAACNRRGVPALLVNGRLSARSARGYQRLKRLTQDMLGHLDALLVQTPAHRQRFLALGADPDKVTAVGSIKFDQTRPQDFGARVAHLKQTVGSQRVVLGASTHDGEESLLLACFQTLKIEVPGLKLILAPRHVHRTAEVAASIADLGLHCVRHSEGATGAQADVYLVDTMGELIYFYGLAEVAVVGGSFVPVGGHNLMEAAIAGTPVVMGPHLDNIEDIAAEFIEAGALRVASRDSLVMVLHELLASEDARHAQVNSANRVLEHNRGALQSVYHVLENFVRERGRV